MHKIIIILMVIVVNWYGWLQPIQAELNHLRHKVSMAYNDFNGAEALLLKAIEHDRTNSAYHFYLANIYVWNMRQPSKGLEEVNKAIAYRSGHLVPWGVYYTKARAQHMTGDLYGSKRSFQKSIYYLPSFQPSVDGLAGVSELIKNIILAGVS